MEYGARIPRKSATESGRSFIYDFFFCIPATMDAYYVYICLKKSPFTPWTCKRFEERNEADTYFSEAREECLREQALAIPINKYIPRMFHVPLIESSIQKRFGQVVMED
jgi:hypothetical protein